MNVRARTGRTTSLRVLPGRTACRRAVVLVAAALVSDGTNGAPGGDDGPRPSPVASVDAPAEPTGTGGTGGEVAGTSRRASDPDRLGEARLFFSAEERGPDDGPVGGRDGERVEADAASPETIAPTPPGPDLARAARSPAAAASGRASAVSPIPPRFQAVLRVDGQVRVVLGDRPCRGDGLTGRLSCDPLPAGVRELSIDPDGRRLRVTWLDGRRRTLAVGAVLRP